MGLGKNWESALVSHKAKVGNGSKSGTASRRSEAPLLRLEIHANQAAADSKLGTILQHGRAHPFFVVVSAVGRVQVLEIDVRISYFQQAMMPRYFRIIQRNVRAFAPQRDSRLVKRVLHTFLMVRQN